MLKKCLRCGSKNIKLQEWYSGDSSIPSFRYRCEKHAWDEWLETKEEAELAWNERPERKVKEPTLFFVELLETTAYNSIGDILKVKAVDDDGNIYYYDNVRRWCYLTPNDKWRKYDKRRT